MESVPAADGASLAASLTDRLAALTFADRSADEVTALLVGAVVSWGTDRGWRVYRRAPSVLPLPPPYAHRHSWVDVACARPAGAPVVVEVDRTDRRRTVEKLLAEAAAGRVALWLRWGDGRVAPPPSPVHLVTCPVTARRGRAGAERRYSRDPAGGRAAPAHTGDDLRAGGQPELFPGPPPGE